MGQGSGLEVVWRSSDPNSLSHFRGLTSPGERGSGLEGFHGSGVWIRGVPRFRGLD